LRFTHRGIEYDPDRVVVHGCRANTHEHCVVEAMLAIERRPCARLLNSSLLNSSPSLE
jgi:hypothetical protein